MKCPACDVDLVMAERQGTEIDYCPKCRGVWLDRGELDKIIEKSLAVEAPRASAPRDYPRDYRGDDRRYDDDRYHGSHGHKPYRKKRESFLSELFDF